MDALLGGEYELRLLPKVVAKAFMSLSSLDGSTPVQDIKPEALEKFGQDVTMLSAGVQMELWRTFLYHLKLSAQEPSSHVSRAINYLSEKLMYTFLERACLVDQCLPEKTVAKVVELINQTQETLEKLQLSRISLALAEMAILMNHLRRDYDDMSGQTEVALVGCEATIAGNWLLKRKAQSLQEDCVKKKPAMAPLHLTVDDVLVNLPSLHAFIDKMDKQILLKVAAHFVQHPVLLERHAYLIEENLCLGEALIGHLLQLLDDQGSKFHGALLNWEHDDAVLTLPTDSAVHLELEPVVNVLKVLPLECYNGRFEVCVELLIVGLLPAAAQSQPEARTALWRALSRCLEAIYRKPSLLKWVDYGSLMGLLSSPSANDALFQEAICRSLARVLVTYQKTLESVSECLEDLVCIDTAAQWEPSLALVEALADTLIACRNQEKLASKRELCLGHFKKLNKKLHKLLAAQDLGSVAANLKLCAVRLLTAVLRLAAGGHSEKRIKKWSAVIADFAAPFCLQLLTSQSSTEATISCRFLAVLVAEHAIVQHFLPQDFILGVWTIIVDSSSCLHQTDVFLHLVTQLFLIEDASLLESMAGLLINRTDGLLLQLADMELVMRLWTCFAQLTLSEPSACVRKVAVESLLFRVHQLNPDTLSLQALLRVTVPCFRLEAALLNSERWVVSRRTEAFCLQNASSLDLCSVWTGCQRNVSDFREVWLGAYSVLSAALHRRFEMLVMPRIPVALLIFRNVVCSLSMASDQKHCLQPSDVDKLGVMGHLVDRVCEQMARNKEDWARVAPHLVSDLIDCFHRFTLISAVKSNLLLAVYKLLDLSDKHSMQMLASNLPGGWKDIFKYVASEYRKYYQFHGKI